MAYQVALAPAAVRDLKRIKDRTALRRMRDAIDGLADNPRPSGAKKLSGAENLWRVRVGDYRIVYEVHDKRLLVLVARLGHRRDVYQSGT